MNIRLAKKTDLDAIQKVIETAFSDAENKAIINLVAEMSGETTNPPIKSLVAEIDHQVVGYVAYSPIFMPSNTDITGYILAPLALSPEHQKKGIGSTLVKSGIDMLTTEGVDVLLVYGDPDYYERFGFREETGHLFVPPYPLQYPFGWLGMMLNETDAPAASIKFDCIAALSHADLW